MARIFISYKREDKEVVFKIKDNIEKHVGEKCWIDLDGIESDAQFVNVIINAIDEAEIFLFMYSKKHAEITDFEIDWTIREINYAQTEGKRIIFLNIDRTPLSKWFKMMFGLKQQVDVHSNVAMNKLYADLTKWLEKRSEGSEISLKSDLDCRVYKDGLEWCSLRKGETKVVLLLKGTYKLNFVSNENSADYYEEDCVVEDNDIKKYLNISLLPIKEKREKEEKRKSGNMWKEKLGAIGTNLKNGILVNKQLFSKLAIVLAIIVMLFGLFYTIYNEFSNGGGDKKERYEEKTTRAYINGRWVTVDAEEGWVTVDSRIENHNNKEVVCVAEEIVCVAEEVVESDEMKEKINGHEYVDLGLSVKWATCNMGATKPEELGDYFAWGETTTKTDYSWATYKYCKGTYTTITKYCTISRYGNNGFIDNKIVLDLEDDAAHVNWGGPWRMPTKGEQRELKKKCTWIRTNQNGVNGYKVVGKNGNSIFFPDVCFMKGTELYDDAGLYGYGWKDVAALLSSTLNADCPNGVYGMYLNPDRGEYDGGGYFRAYGRPIRPVCP